MRIPAFELDDDGLPSPEWGYAFRNADMIEPSDAAAFMLESLPAICQRLPGELRIEDGTDHLGPIKRVHFATNCFTACEILAEAMLAHAWINSFMTMWKRGGYYEFEIPTRHIKAADAAQAA